jgi:glycosyltransferase involved in cell wall biosynthesis
MAEPLRLLLWHWGRRGGGPRYTLELARALASRPGIELSLSLSRQSELFAETDAIDVPHHHVDTYQNASTFMLRSLSLPLIRRRFLDFVIKSRIDVVYNTMDFLWGSALAPGVTRTRALYMLAVHDAERHPGEDGKLRRWLLSRDIAAADGIITMTEAVRERLLAVHPFPAERAWTAPLGVFINDANGRVRELPNARPIRLLYFGRLLPYKGLDIMLQALPLIRAARPDVELEVWCSGDLAPYRSAIERTNGLRLEHRWIHEDEVPGIFERTDICVLPYREASQSAVIATALASGMPIVTTPIPGLIEQTGGSRAGRISADFTPAAFAAAVLDLVSDPILYGQLSGNAVEISRTQLSWDSIAERVEAAARALATLGPRAVNHSR